MTELAVVVTGGVAAAFVAIVTAHIHLRRLLARRGDTTWGFGSTMAAIPLIIIGSAGLGGAVAWGLMSSGLALPPLMVAVSAGNLSLYVLVLGVLALRKFNR